MNLAIELVLVFSTFLLVLVTVIVLAFRERHLSEKLDAANVDAARARASDRRVMIVIFGSITSGMLLTLVTAAIVLGR